MIIASEQQNENPPSGYMESRGLQEALELAKWERSANGNYFVPMYHLDGSPAYWRATYNLPGYWRDTHGKVNLSGKPKRLRYYCLPRLTEYVRAAFGVCYLASGLTDTLAFIASGRLNVIGLLAGEASVPVTFVSDMEKIGVSELVYYPDNDKSGEASALKVWKSLRKSPIKVSIFRLPAEADDIAQVWEYSRPKFSRMLAKSTRMLFVEDQKIRKLPKKTNTASLGDQITKVLIERGGKLHNGKIAIYSWLPHAKDKPGQHAYFYPSDCHAYEYSKGEWMGAKQLSLWLGIEQPKQESEPAKVKFLRHHAVQSGFCDAARWLDCMCYHGLTPNTPYSVEEISKATGIPLKTVYRAVKRIGDFFSSLSCISFSSENTVRREKKSSTGGRPRNVLLFPDVEKVAELMGAKWSAGEKVTSESLSSDSDYRAWLHLSSVAAAGTEGVKLPAKSLARRIGRSDRTLRRYENKLIAAGKMVRKRRWREAVIGSEYSLSEVEKKRGCRTRHRSGRRVLLTPLASQRVAI